MVKLKILTSFGMPENQTLLIENVTHRAEVSETATTFSYKFFTIV